MDLNYIIRSELLRQNKDIKFLAQKFGCTKENLYNKLNRNDMKISTIERIAEALDCDLEIKFIPRNQD